MINPSPLRYPGGKFRFRDLIAQTISNNHQPPTTLIEPFCGGAGASLSLLCSDVVEAVALNDADPLVASFWRVVFGKSRSDRTDLNWLISKIECEPITIAAWKEMRACQPTSTRELAWKCLLLNRTSFNGILNKSGPIGGWNQNLRTLDVRFNRATLVSKIEALWSRRCQVVDVRNEDWHLFCNRFKNSKENFFYLDPPYYHKAEQLYQHLFDRAQHVKLQNYLIDSSDSWLLSYDDSVEVRELYGHFPGVNGVIIDKKYSTNPMGGVSYIGRELFLSNQPMLINEKKAVARRGFEVVANMLSSNAPTAGPVRVNITRAI